MTHSVASEKQIDWVQADALMGDHPGFGEELLLKLLKDLRETQALFQAYYAKEDWLALEENVHKLHGACCYCGVPVLKRAVQVLERAAGDKPSTERIKPKLDAFNRSVDRLFAEAATDSRLLKAQQDHKS